MHFIEDDLNEPERWILAGIAQLETLLARHAAFQAFCDERDR